MWPLLHRAKLWTWCQVPRRTSSLLFRCIKIENGFELHNALLHLFCHKFFFVTVRRFLFSDCCMTTRCSTEKKNYLSNDLMGEGGTCEKKRFLLSNSGLLCFLNRRCVAAGKTRRALFCSFYSTQIQTVEIPQIRSNFHGIISCYVYN